MPMLPQEAANALQDIERAERHSAALYGYRRASPHLFLWGAIWVIGFGASFLRRDGSLVWLGLVPLGILASFSISHGSKSSRARFGWRYGLTAIALFLFITAVFYILPIKSVEQPGAFISLLVALFYVLLGLWRGAARMAILGFALGALTVGGYLGLPHYFLLWMAGVGGGALILGGFWLRRV